MEIGDWVSRYGPWHYVDSVVAERVVSRCGKEMNLQMPKRRTLQRSVIAPPSLAEQCQSCKRSLEKEFTGS